MEQKEIRIKVTLDEKRMPERIMWDADEKGDGGMAEAKCMSLALWDSERFNTLRMDLWTKDMPVHEMKQFYLNCLRGMAQNILNSTGDEKMAGATNALANELEPIVEEELRKVGLNR